MGAFPDAWAGPLRRCIVTRGRDPSTPSSARRCCGASPGAWAGPTLAEGPPGIERGIPGRVGGAPARTTVGAAAHCGCPARAPGTNSEPPTPTLIPDVPLAHPGSRRARGAPPAAPPMPGRLGTTHRPDRSESVDHLPSSTAKRMGCFGTVVHRPRLTAFRPRSALLRGRRTAGFPVGCRSDHRCTAPTSDPPG